MAKLTDGIVTGGMPPIGPGETRTWVEPKSGRTFTLYRTERDYVFDLCDCYNAARSDEARARGVEWYVTPSGELKIGHSFDSMIATAKRDESRKRTETAIALRRQHDRPVAEDA